MIHNKNYRNIISILMIVIGSAYNIVWAEEEKMEIGIDEQLDNYIPGDIQVISENGDTINLKNQIDKPTILSLVYYRCPGICSPLMDGLLDVMEKSDLEPGKDYQVLTVSFNPTENYQLAKRKKNNYIKSTEKEELNTAWKFFVADSANIKKLTSSVGFHYKKTGNDYLHSGTLIFISDNGKITRYLNGTRFLPFEFKMALVETSKGKSGPTINKVLQYCYSYDPSGQGYVLNITRIAGGFIMFILMGLFVILSVRKIKHKRNKS